MKDGRYEVGDTVTVYDKTHTNKELCDHHVTHNVPVYAVKKLTISEIRSELVIALHYTQDGYGDVLYAVDAQGREYRKAPHWDGPRASVWVRFQPALNERKTFDQYPPKVYSRDLTGRGFIP